MTATFRRKEKVQYGPFEFIPRGHEPVRIYALIEEWNRGIPPSGEDTCRLLSNFESVLLNMTQAGKLSPGGQTKLEAITKVVQIVAKCNIERNNDMIFQRLATHFRLAIRNAHFKNTKSGRMEVGGGVQVFGREDADVQLAIEQVDDALGTIRKESYRMVAFIRLYITSSQFRELFMNSIKVIQKIVEMCDPDDAKSYQEKGRDSYGAPKDIAKMYNSSKPTIEIYAPKKFNADGNVEKSHEMDDGFLLDSGRDAVDHEIKWSSNLYSKEKSSKSVIASIREICDNLHDNEEYLVSVFAIGEFFNVLVEKARVLEGEARPIVGGEDANIGAAIDDIKTIIERFAGGYSLDSVVKALGGLQNVLNSNVPRESDGGSKNIERAPDTSPSLNDNDGCYWETMDLIADWKHLLNMYCKDKKFSRSFEGETRGISLVERTVLIISKRYYKACDKLVDEWGKFVNAWNSDKLTSELGNSIKEAAVVRTSQVDSGLLGDLQTVVVPAIIESMENLPLPHIEVTDDRSNTRMSMDQVYIPSSIFSPNNVVISSSSSSANMRETGGIGRADWPGWMSRMHLSIYGMRGDIRNVRYALDRRSWPRIRHQGLMDIKVGGHRHGLSIAVDLQLGDDNTTKSIVRFQPEFVQVKCSKISLNFIENLQVSGGRKTPFTMNVGKPLMEGRLRSRLERAICDRIVTVLTAIDTLGAGLASI